MIVKWGGVLTHLGRRQAEELGNIYRMVMYPNSADGGLLRLHSTYRHDLKIYSSDEGRVQTSAAAFAKGLLDLEGDSLVRWFFHQFLGVEICSFFVFGRCAQFFHPANLHTHNHMLPLKPHTHVRSEFTLVTRHPKNETSE